MTIRKAVAADAAEIAKLASGLWPNHTAEELTADFSACLTDAETAVFLLLAADARAVGFAQCGLRHDYVEGTAGSPVGYLEGIFVAPDYRRGGWAKALLACCEAWARERGCNEFASDCALENAESIAFHLRTGFAEANRIVCFVKAL